MINKFKYVVLFLLFSNVVFANAPGRIGFGIILGEPTGISFKTWQSDEIAYDAALAWSLGKDGKVHVHVDYLIHNYKLIRTIKSNTPIYYGIGGRIKTKDETVLGVRIPLGINFKSRKIPIDVFIEIVPTFNLIPQTEFDLEGGIGVRYYF